MNRLGPSKHELEKQDLDGSKGQVERETDTNVGV